ncbi:endonuclease/Exonuclease/phosphatase family protein [Asticcacaulis biprosthecium C19]|uniref:Endonuclease/Exonuclease/phosphatase family protein n=1 Tax=Asticcacaulis biprosthecium C19 TaxID=715226 RepID=F4QRY7_9CAUL|nr:endonuclease/exonuclease/phosphatase family protein [Asticcacaulis biprosthecium]EGF89507.1 endonuclease/Exonuclease/phosphatase family protein [Asticcacaulis biprosthecium C19]
MLRLLQRILKTAGIAIGAAMVLIAVICLLNPHRPLFYLIDIFSVPILTAFAAILALLALLRQRWAGGLAAMGCLLMVVSIWPQAFPKQAAPDMNKPPVRLVFANLLIRNTEPEKLLPWVEKQNPDIVALIEANPAARDELIKGLKATRPYVATRYDMVVVSRYPLKRPSPRQAGLALMTVEVESPGQPFTLAVTHLTRPWPFSDPQDQRRQFSRLARSLERIADEDLVLVGDFNTPPCASGMGDFMDETGLHAAPMWRGTWPSFLPSVLRIGIDNLLASPDRVLSRRQVGGFTGSDHRPVVVDIRPARRD